MGYQTRGFGTTSLSKLLRTLRLSMFDILQLQWSDIGGQNGGQNAGQIESSYKYIMWGIKLKDLIPQAYLDYLEH